MHTPPLRPSRQTLRLGVIGLALLGVGLFNPREGSRAGESLWTIARDSAWKRLGDWPAAAASLRLMLASAGFFFLALALRRMWDEWIGARVIHWVILAVSLFPVVSLLVGLYYLLKAVF